MQAAMHAASGTVTHRATQPAQRASTMTPTSASASLSRTALTPEQLFPWHLAWAVHQVQARAVHPSSGLQPLLTIDNRTPRLVGFRCSEPSADRVNCLEPCAALSALHQGYGFP